MIKFDVRINDAKLKEIVSELEMNKVSVGIIGDAGMRTDSSGVSTLEKGLKNEFGSISERIPERSFLRKPITAKLPEEKPKMQNMLLGAVEDGEYKKFFQKVGNLGVRIVDDAFATRGFGRWAENSKKTLKKKAPATEPLIWHGELRKSISYKVNA